MRAPECWNRRINDALDYAGVDPTVLIEARRLVNNELRPAIEQHILERVREKQSAIQSEAPMEVSYA